MVNFVDANYVQRRLGDGAVVLNVLSEEQYEERHIPGSINVPNDAPDFNDRVLQAVPQKDTPVIVHCSSMQCPASTQAARKLKSLGYTEVYDYKAGIEDWVGADRATETGPSSRPQPTRGDRPERVRTQASRADPVASELTADSTD